MSARGSFYPTLCLGCLVAAITAAGAGNTTRPASTTGDGQKQIGTVIRALHYLYSIPRKPGGGLAGSANTPSANTPSANTPSAPVPQSPAATSTAARERPVTGDTSHLGLQHRDAIRNSVSDQVTIGDDINGRRIDQPPSASSPDHREHTIAPGGAPESDVFIGGPYNDFYGRRAKRLPYSQRKYSDYRYFNGQPSRYGYGYRGFGDDYTGEVYRFGFNQGRDQGRNEKFMTERQETVLAHGSTHLNRGIVLFRDGRDRESVDAFRLASDTNQGDPASRIYSAHALFAVGRYRDAVKYLRKAFELQPKMVMLNFDMRDDYGRRADFDRQLAELGEALDRSPHDLDRIMVLGYVRYYSGQRDQAYEVFEKARRIEPRDPLAEKFMDACQPSDVALDKATAERKANSKTQK